MDRTGPFLRGETDENLFEIKYNQWTGVGRRCRFGGRREHRRIFVYTSETTSTRGTAEFMAQSPSALTARHSQRATVPLVQCMVQIKSGAMLIFDEAGDLLQTETDIYCAHLVRRLREENTAVRGQVNILKGQLEKKVLTKLS